MHLKLIDCSLLTSEEIVWINDYHALVRKDLIPLLKDQDLLALQWLIRETQPLVL